MSNFVNSGAAALWLDGDAFRCPAACAPPLNPFATQPQVTVASVLTNMDAFGGIEAGFKVTPSQAVKDFDVWNDKSGAPYATDKKPATALIACRPTDYSKATVLTILTGGTISTYATGVYEWNMGPDEEFGLLIRVQSGGKWEGFFLERATLATPPPHTMDDSDIAGWDMEFKPLAPVNGDKAIRPFTNWNPLA
jgi:hypothetical protein